MSYDHLEINLKCQFGA